MNKLILGKTLLDRWFHNLQVFLAPVGVVYLLAVVGIITANNGTIQAKDFIPTSFTWGAITLYVANTALDYLRKLKS